MDNLVQVVCLMENTVQMLTSLGRTFSVTGSDDKIFETNAPAQSIEVKLTALDKCAKTDSSVVRRAKRLAKGKLVYVRINRKEHVNCVLLSVEENYGQALRVVEPRLDQLSERSTPGDLQSLGVLKSIVQGAIRTTSTIKVKESSTNLSNDKVCIEDSDLPTVDGPLEWTETVTAMRKAAIEAETEELTTFQLTEDTGELKQEISDDRDTGIGLNRDHEDGLSLKDREALTQDVAMTCYTKATDLKVYLLITQVQLMLRASEVILTRVM
ncbi:hypothetical protein JG687_00006234 [Phytophthora cactorum]|uniref:Uncharacterized protein n=2 Tax=Phytophthora cactorum TaxID=29920 RepID=A0A329SKJ1_9STRA|nr:hypothetical protein PC128_g21448 [Phytophthora cactorum]KAG6963982.1 hypothetical protein JG687_00006234 [Phytophthora cactorum]RAW37091.1 hypothetical protein PC110_g6650 [Phytophthora cactorum]